MWSHELSPVRVPTSEFVVATVGFLRSLEESGLVREMLIGISIFSGQVPGGDD